MVCIWFPDFQVFLLLQPELQFYQQLGASSKLRLQWQKVSLPCCVSYFANSCFKFLVTSYSFVTSFRADLVVWISVVILIFLFMIQRFGTDKVGYSFAPIMFVWFLFIGGIGFYNIIKFDPLIVKAINPQYIIAYFSRNRKAAWISLGDIILCITGLNLLFLLCSCINLFVLRRRKIKNLVENLFILMQELKHYLLMLGILLFYQYK